MERNHERIRKRREDANKKAEYTKIFAGMPINRRKTGRDYTYGSYFSHAAKDAEAHEKLARQYLSGHKPRKAVKSYLTAAKICEELAEEYRLSAPESEHYGKVADRYALKADKDRRNANRIVKVLKGEWKGLEGKTTATAAILGILGGMLFLSSNITGNVIGSLNQTSSSWIGVVLFIIGLIGAFIYFKNKEF